MAIDCGGLERLRVPWYPAKKKSLSRMILPPSGAAELVAFQAVVSGGEVVAGVDIAVAQEFEQVAMQSIGAGLGDDVDQASGMVAVARRQGTGLDAEFLERVRERDRAG